MIDWTSSMQQSFEYYEVDPDTWKDKQQIATVKKCNINRDPEAETLGSATFDVDNSVGECYIRSYLVVKQDGIKDKIPLGTFLVQTPSSTFDGRVRNVSMDAYTPLIELKEKMPPLGYYARKGDDVMMTAFDLINEHARAPVSWPHSVVKNENDEDVRVPTLSSTKLEDNLPADPDETWLSFVKDLITSAYTVTAYAVENDSGDYKRSYKTVDVVNTTNNETGLTTDTGEKVLEGTIRSTREVKYCVVSDTCYEVENQNGIYVRTDTVLSNINSGFMVGELDVTSTGENIWIGHVTEQTSGYYCTLTNHSKYKLNLDGLGQISFEPERELSSMEPVWTYSDDNSSILHADLSMDHDLYGIPNVVEVVYSDGDETWHKIARNVDPNSPTSQMNRGRWIWHRVRDPELYGKPSEERVAEYAKQVLKDLSTIEYKVTYTHGYCPTNVGDCVRIHYEKAGLTNIKAKVISQSISCETGCPVDETAVFTSELINENYITVE